MRPKSLSLILPVYDDKSQIEKVIEDIKRKFKDLGLDDYELLIFLDSRVARLTKQILDDLSGKDMAGRIKVFDGEAHQKIGTIFAEGIKKSSKDFIGIYPAYNQIDVSSFDSIVPNLGGSDVTVCYVKNPSARPCYRATFSRLNVLLLNLISGLNLKYYHLYFFRADLAKKIELKSKGHSALSEVLIWLIKSGASFVQVPFIIIPHSFSSKSRAFDFSNLIECVLTYLSLFIDLRLLGKRINL